MIDPMIYQLVQVRHQERLQEAEAARQQRATGVAAPNPIARLRQAVGRQLISLGQRMQAPAVPTKVYR